MRAPPVPLIRTFARLPDWAHGTDVDLDGGWDGWFTSEREDWSALCDQKRVVILADPGAGKTFEMCAQAQRLFDEGRAAFFIRIEDLAGDFTAAFEVGSAETYAGWRAGTEDAWFFLDSVDEARLDTPRAFEQALKAFAEEIHDAKQRVKLFISSRPYAWRPGEDLALVETLFPTGDTEIERRGLADGAEGKAEDIRNSRKSDVALYRLRALDPDDIRLFAGHRAAPDIEGLMGEIERVALGELAGRPFDLEDILTVWREDRSLASRLQVLQRAVSLQLSPNYAKHRLDADQARDGVRRLAFAVTMTGRPEIRLPGAPTDHAGFDACALLDGWDREDVAALLTRGVFSDPTYGGVRFRHREVRELLAAEWIGDQLRKADAREDFENLIFRDQYGVASIAPRLRPLAPWLMLFDTRVGDRLLAIAPSIVAEGGDASRLPHAVRAPVLAEMTAWIARDERSGVIDNTAVARIAQPDLADQVGDLIAEHLDSDEAIFFLARLVWQGRMAGCSRPLSGVALNPYRGDYARTVAVRAVVAAEGEGARTTLWRALNTLGGIPPILIRELLTDAPASQETLGLLLDSIPRLSGQPGRYDSSGLTEAVLAIIPKLPAQGATPGQPPSFQLVAGVNDLLSGAVDLDEDDDEYEEISRTYRWLVDPALHAMTRLATRRAAEALGPPCLALLEYAAGLESWERRNGDEGKRAELKTLIPRWPELNDALFWRAVVRARAVAEVKGRTVDDEWDVAWRGRFWRFGPDAFERVLPWIRSMTLADDRLIALSLAFRLYVQEGRLRSSRRRLKAAVSGDSTLEATLKLRLKPPARSKSSDWRKGQRRREKRWKAREAREAVNCAAFVSRVRADPEAIRAPKEVKIDELTWDQYSLLRIIEGDGMRRSRSEAAAWRVLEPEFGGAVAEAFRDAAVAKWRAYRPTVGSDGMDRTSVPYVLIFAMAGLAIEAGDDGLGLARLPEAEAMKALRYVVWELNGFPKWFQPLYEAYPGLTETFVWRELEWELRSTEPDGGGHYILHDLLYHAPWLHRVLAPRVADWWRENEIRHPDLARYARRLLISASLSRPVLADLAKTKLASPGTPPDQSPRWTALWVDADPSEGLAALEARLADLGALEATHFAETFAVNLIGGRHEGEQSAGGLSEPADVARLYTLLHRHIRVADDIERAGKGAYSPGLRDNAQDAREALLSRLADTPGEAAFGAMMALAEHHPEPSYRKYMERRARLRAVTDGDVGPWTDEEAQAFVRAK